MTRRREGQRSDPPGESWDSYRKKITDDLAELKEESKEQLKQLNLMASNVAVLQARVSWLGAAAGAVAAAVVSVIAQLMAWRFR